MRARPPQKLVYVALQEASKKRKKGCTKGSRFKSVLLEAATFCFLLRGSIKSVVLELNELDFSGLLFSIEGPKQQQKQFSNGSEVDE